MFNNKCCAKSMVLVIWSLCLSPVDVFPLILLSYVCSDTRTLVFSLSANITERLCSSNCRSNSVKSEPKPSQDMINARDHLKSECYNNLVDHKYSSQLLSLL